MSQLSNSSGLFIFASVDSPSTTSETMAPSATHAPVAATVPAPPSSDWMCQEDWDLLWSLLDAMMPSITSASAVTDPYNQIVLSDKELEEAVDRVETALVHPPSRNDIIKYLNQRPSLNEAFRDDVRILLAGSPGRNDLAKALTFLRSRFGSLLLTWCWSPLDQYPVEVREGIIKSWRNGNMRGMRVLSKTFATVIGKANAVHNTFFHKLCGYTDVPRNWRPVQGYEFIFTQLDAGSEPHVIETDVVIVGSGPGGGLTAKNLAEAGHKVLVVDKGYWYPPSHLPMTQAAGNNLLYAVGGAQISEDGGLVTLSGSTWGGGGTVNWSVCLDPPDFVRTEWADAGLPLFRNSEFDECLARVNKLVGASTKGLTHNHQNRVLLKGCEKLGWKAAEAPQNTAGKTHACGQCHLGCGSGEKMGPSVTSLPAAAKAGAEFMEGFKVEKVLFAADDVTAVGVEGVWTARGPNGLVHMPESQRLQRRVIVRAKKVVIAGGALYSPLILMQSGVENAHLGKNLHLHPCNVVTAVCKEETRPWEGSIISSYGSEFDNLDGKGHGVKLEPICSVPYALLAPQMWRNALDTKLLQLQYGHMIGYIALTRDRDGGEVWPDPKTGLPRMKYEVSEFDRENAMVGVQALAKLCYVSGAKEIRPCIAGVAPFVTDPSKYDASGISPLDDGKKVKDPQLEDPRFAAWLLELRQMGNANPEASWQTAHQMSTCRMGATADDGVVDSMGRVWGKKGLYVADSSVLPSASGVNPMITTLALADWISRGMVKEMAD